jgi:NADP-dependent 3-hydroxy acid dehydrogenase YdfG
LPHLLQAAASAPRHVADVVNISSVAGRVARPGFGVYNATKFGVGAFSEALRQEVTARHVRVTIVEPGVVATELVGHNRPEMQQVMGQTFGAMEPLHSEDIADAVVYAVTRPRHVVLNELLVRPTEQER